MNALHLMHDVLDSQLVDRYGAKMGRVDGLVLELRDGAAPRVSAMLTGGVTLAERFGRRAGAVARRIRGVLTPHAGAPVAIPFASVRVIGRCVQLDIDAAEARTMAFEHWLRSHVMVHIPGAE